MTRSTFQRAVDLFYSKIETPYNDFAEHQDLDGRIEALGLSEELLKAASAEAERQWDQDIYLADLYDEARFAVKMGLACWMHEEDN